MVLVEGIEPPLIGSKPIVLPLDYTKIYIAGFIIRVARALLYNTALPWSEVPRVILVASMRIELVLRDYRSRVLPLN